MFLLHVASLLLARFLQDLAYLSCATMFFFLTLWHLIAEKAEIGSVVFRTLC